MNTPRAPKASRPPHPRPPAAAIGPALLVAITLALLLSLLFSLGAADPAFAEPPGNDAPGGTHGKGWAPLTNMLGLLVPVAGGICIVVGAGIAAASGSNSEGRELGWKIVGGGFGGFLLGLLAPDLAAFFTQW